MFLAALPGNLSPSREAVAWTTMMAYKSACLGHIRFLYCEAFDTFVEDVLKNLWVPLALPLVTNHPPADEIFRDPKAQSSPTSSRS